MKIRNSVLVLLISVIVSIGATSYIGIGIIQNDVIDIVEHEMPKIQYALEMEVYINEMAQDVLENLAQVPQETTFADDAEKFRFYHDQYTALELTEHEKELMVQIDTKFEQFVFLGNELIEIEELELIEIEQEHAEKVFELEQMKLAEYNKFHTLLTEMDYILDNELQVEAVEKISEEEHEVIATIQEFIIVLAVVFAITLAVGYMITHRIGKRMNRLVELTLKVEKGDYSVRSKDIGNDEIGYLGRALNQSVIQLQEVNRQKDEFASMITHELKTPLVPILGFCDILKDPQSGEMNELQKDSIDEIHKNANELLHLIQNMLNAQKVEMHKLKFNLKTIDVNKYMKGRYKNLEYLMKDKKIDFQNFCTSELKIKGDEEKINEIFSNMVLNAIDFVPEKGKIDIHATESDHMVLFSVKDNGIGIPKNKIGNMFKKFYQADTTATRKHGGSGLGLAICKGFVEGMGGKSWLESEEGKGTTFFFTIPRVM